MLILSIGNIWYCVIIIDLLVVNSETHNCNFGQHISLRNIILYDFLFIFINQFTDV